MASLLRRASSWAMTKAKDRGGHEAGAAESPFVLGADSRGGAEEGVRVKSKAIKTVPGSRTLGKTKAKSIPKSAVERELIESALKGNFVFAELNPGQVESMVLAFERQNVRAGRDLIVQGDTGDFFYLVETGTFDFIVSGTKVGQCGACGSFGELALLYDTKRAATVACTSAATVFALNRETFKFALFNDVQTYSGEITEALKRVPLFAENLRLDEMQRIADVLEVVKYPHGASIIQKGDVGTTFYIIKEGSVVCTEIGDGNPRVPDVPLRAGRYFGERALISKEPRAASVLAAEDCTLLSLNGSNFEALLGGLNKRMAAAAVAEDEELRSTKSIKGGMLGRLGKASTKKTGWTLTTRPDIMLDGLQEVARLGSGSFGYVRMVLHEGTQEVFALKSMLREDIKAQRSEQSVMDEKDLMAEVAHPFIVNLVNTYKSSKRLYMLMECVQGGELYSRIHTNSEGLDRATVCFYAANVAVALHHLHSKDIVYRDLKPENLLVDRSGYLKVCDFGFAVRLPLGQKTYTLCGTVEYLAPELLIGKGHNRGVDWWALGVLVFEMLAFKTPFEDKDRKEETTMRNILKQSLAFPSTSAFDLDSKDLITCLLQKAPTERLESEYRESGLIFQHSYFRSLNFDAINARSVRAPWVPALIANTDSSHFDS